MRRISYALFVLAGLSVLIALASLAYGIGGPGAFRARAIGYGMLNLGFGVVNGILGVVMLRLSRTPGKL